MSEIIAATGGPQYNVLKRLRAKGVRVRSAKEGAETRYWVDAAVPHYEIELNAKGQATLPKDLRSRAGLTEGSKMHVSLEEGRIVLRLSQTSIRSSLGLFHRKGRKPATQADIDDAIAQGAIEGAIGKRRRRR